MGGTKEARVKFNPADRGRADRLTEALSLRTVIRRNQRGGELAIYFSDDKELDDIIKKLSSQ